SRRLAEAIQQSLVAKLGPNRRQARPADLRILRDVEAPAALVEVGFLSNPEEERRLQDPEYQWRVAEAIADGIFAFLAAQYAGEPTSRGRPGGGRGGSEENAGRPTKLSYKNWQSGRILAIRAEDTPAMGIAYTAKGNQIVPVTRRLVIRGRKVRDGRVRISGAKNSAVALLPATLLADGESV